MNGIHDMGGMHGFGPIAPEENEPVFHAPWEGRALALTLAVAAWGKWTIDESRHARERIRPDIYLSSSYYERWIEGLNTLMVEHGLVTPDELASGHPDPDAAVLTPPIHADRVADVLRKGGPADRAADAAPRFTVGQRVRARNINPVGHTRLPRYARGKVGVIEIHHGAHVFPDSNAHHSGERPQHLYNVRFTARELWDDKAPGRDNVHLDLWESYLDLA
jgi:nitrile hydratase